MQKAASIALQSALGFALAALLLGSPLNAASKSKKPTKVKCSRKASSSYAKLMLPGRMIGAGIESNKEVMNGVKFTAVEKFDPVFANKLFVEASIGGYTVPLFLEYTKDRPGKERPGMLYFGPIANLVHKFYKGRFDGIMKSKDGKVPSENQLMKELLAHLKKSGSSKSAKKSSKKKKKSSKKKKDDKKGDSLLPTGTFKLSGSPKKGRHFTQGKLAALPHGLGSTENTKYWNGALAPYSAYFDMYTTAEWAGTMKATSSAQKYRVAVIYPTGKAHNYGFLRCATALTAKAGKAKVEVKIFDDNLNGTFGDVGEDSMQVGEALGLVGSTLSVGEEVYNMTINPGDGKKTPPYLELTKRKDKPGQVRLTWEGAEESTLHYAILKANDDDAYYGLTQADSKKSSSSSKKKKGEDSGKVKFNEVSVPAGTYTVVAGLASRMTKEMKWPAYASFVGSDTITVEAGETTKITLGGKLTSKISIRAEEDERIIGIDFLKGEGGEKYVSFLPVPEEARLSITGNPDGPFADPLRKIMGVTLKGETFMDTFVKYDPVLFPPENGPFKFSIRVDPLVFETQTITDERKNMNGK
ncbi:MAG: hypothetical protein ACYTGH_03785 [Planctomycetota bacterium]|jgi:hypothetical protein